jgi:hypothetical protein
MSAEADRAEWYRRHLEPHGVRVPLQYPVAKPRSEKVYVTDFAISLLAGMAPYLGQKGSDGGK